MQIVIKIPKDIYMEKDEPSFSNKATLEILQAVKNGIPLPKGHGRLIDADALKNFFEEHAYLVRYDRNSVEQGMSMTGIKACIEESATIIEADKEGENGD